MHIILNLAFRDMVITQYQKAITVFHVWEAGDGLLTVDPLFRLHDVTVDEFLDTLRSAFDIAVERKFGVKDRMRGQWGQMPAIFGAEWEAKDGYLSAENSVTVTAFPDHNPHIIVAES